jgi:hypothetical protein
MQKPIFRRTAALFAVSLALAGCMKSGEDATGARPEAVPALDASHGGARVALPDIDPAALGKLGADSASPDTAATAWFELGITGEGMQPLAYKYPLAKGGLIFEIKGIPAGKQRSFRGTLRNANGILTHDGITVADIKAGAYTDVRLYLAKAGGNANVCVVIEGQKLPACAQDSLPPNPWPVPDSGAIGGCWAVSSDWVTGKVKLYDTQVNGDMGVLLRDSGSALHFTTWARHGDTLAAILVAPNLQDKWRFNGVVYAAGAGWMGSITDYATGKTTSFSAKTLPCSMVVEPGKVPPDSVPVPPKPDSIPLGSIPLPGTGAKQATLCFEMRFDYGTTACERQGFAKITFQDGKITNGNMTVADRPSPFYTSIMGQYDASNISFYGVTKDAGVTVQDTLDLKGRISVDATMAKGDYLRLPSGKTGNWTMKVAPCGASYPVYPDSSCVAKAK